MLDRSNQDNLTFDNSIVEELDTDFASSQARSDSANQQARVDNLKQREGKSATRTVKQALAMKHSKALNMCLSSAV